MRNDVSNSVIAILCMLISVWINQPFKRSGMFQRRGNQVFQGKEYAPILHVFP